MIICNYPVYQFLKQFFSFDLRLFQSILLTSPKPLWAQESRELCFLTLTECGTEGSKDRQVLYFPRAATETLSTEIKLKKSSQKKRSLVSPHMEQGTTDCPVRKLRCIQC